MNGQPGSDAANQAAQEAQLAYLLNAAGQGGGGAGGLMGGFPGAAAAMAGAGRLGLTDSAIEEQILQRASALRAEALMQQQRQHQLGTALAALQQQQSLQQQQQLSALAGLQPGMGGIGMQEQEALYARAAALRELGVGGAPAGLQGVSGMDRLQQLELNRLEEVERRRQQLTALANFGGGARPEGAPQSASELNQDSMRSNSSEAERAPAVAAPPPVPTEKSKEDLRKTPGTVIVPCRARGMPMDHNFKTAYFVISEDAKHGEDLVCSYFACRNGGVKFRYCAYCMAPVAKRNFCRRHDHGMSKLKDGKVAEDDGNQSDSTTSKKGADAEEVMSGAPPQILTVPKEADKTKPQALDLLTSTATSQFLDSNDKKRKKPTDETNAADESPDADGAPDSSGVGALEGEGSQGLRSISAKRRKLWTELLVRRPRSKDPRHLSAWLNEVLTVSEFEIPLDQIHLMPAPAAEESAAGSGSSDEEKKEKKDKKEKNKEPANAKESPSKPKDKSKDDEEPKAKKSKPSEKIEKESSSTTSTTSSSDEKPKEEEDKKSSESKDKSPKKSSSPKKGDDDFAGSFADWRDRKKGKALKKGTGSLRK
mmetsp:Transcript_7030/g.16426  ORF Transcript_7030/g.16426 Transcript_7030/m.16426 type:complete len:596 (+) Transcript_7030:66-1853(+)